MSSGTLDGVEQVLGNLRRAGEAGEEGAREGLQLAARNTLNVSNAQVPFEEGDLSRDGGYSADDDKLLVAISYGRSADTKDYAVAQHEDMSLAHDPGRNAKFLELAMAATREQNLGIVGASIKRRMGT